MVFPGNTSTQAIAARSLVRFDVQDIGAELAILFEDGDVARPLVVGRNISPLVQGPIAVADSEPFRITAQERIEMRCGKASIVMGGRTHHHPRHLPCQPRLRRKPHPGRLDKP